MRGFDLEQLKTLIAAVDTGSFSAAAPLRFLSQSSLSEQLRKLEDAAGAQLLVRGKSGVKPTAAGERLLAHARGILALADAAWRDMHAVPLIGEVHLGISDYLRPGEVTRLLGRLAHHYPGLRIRTRIGKSAEISAAHRSGELALAVVMQVASARPALPAGTHVLRSEPLQWVAARGTVLKPGRAVELALLPETCTLHRVACQALNAHGIPHELAHVASGVAGLQAAVAAGLGIACLNASSIIEHGMIALPEGVLPLLPEVDFMLLPIADDVSGRLNAMAEVVVQTLA